jgi:hypothetical protein
LSINLKPKQDQSSAPCEQRQAFASALAAQFSVTTDAGVKTWPALR